MGFHRNNRSSVYHYSTSQLKIETSQAIYRIKITLVRKSDVYKIEDLTRLRLGLTIFSFI